MTDMTDMTDIGVPPAAVAPSGAQHEIRYGNAVATLVEVGGGLRTYTVGGRDVLDGYALDEMCSGGRGQHLLPWPNRIRDGAYSWEGRAIQAALNDFPGRHAIHGLTRWQSWKLGEHTASAASMMLRLHPAQGYPFSLDLSARHELSASGLTVTVRAANIGRQAAPFAYAPHPYLASGSGALVDLDVLHVPADSCLLPDDDGINTVAAPCEGSGVDFRTPRAVGAQKLDTTFADLARDPDGLARIAFTAASGDSGVTVWFDESFRWAQVFSGDTLPQPERRRRSLAIEAMSAPANAFASGVGVVRLEPGEQWVGTWGITPS